MLSKDRINKNKRRTKTNRSHFAKYKHQVVIMQCPNCGEEIEKTIKCPFCGGPMKVVSVISSENSDIPLENMELEDANEKHKEIPVVTLFDDDDDDAIGLTDVDVDNL